MRRNSLGRIKFAAPLSTFTSSTTDLTRLTGLFCPLLTRGLLSIEMSSQEFSSLYWLPALCYVGREWRTWTNGLPGHIYHVVVVVTMSNIYSEFLWVLKQIQDKPVLNLDYFKNSWKFCSHEKTEIYLKWKYVKHSSKTMSSSFSASLFLFEDK